jgi:hypothetical protein
LSITVLPPPPPDAHALQSPAAPVLAVRHEADDLCVRFWTR